MTGGAGFIGSNIVHALNRRGRTDILVVDDMTDGRKCVSLADATIADYMDKDEFRAAIRADRLGIEVEAIFHQGACSDTMEQDGRFIMDTNFTCSKEILRWVIAHEVPLVYASSAAIYGASSTFTERAENERPLNVYGYSKLAFDQLVRREAPRARSTVVGLRYFNVYGPGEAHKGRMASVAFHLQQQLANGDEVRLFEYHGPHDHGEQRRDFVYVDDVVDANLHFAYGPPRTGIFNVGSGHARSFNDVARTLIRLHGRGRVSYFPMPKSLRGKYQDFTQADLSALRAAGYTKPTTSLEDGLARYQKALAGAPRG